MLCQLCNLIQQLDRGQNGTIVGGSSKPCASALRATPRSEMTLWYEYSTCTNEDTAYNWSRRMELTCTLGRKISVQSQNTLSHKTLVWCCCLNFQAEKTAASFNVAEVNKNHFDKSRTLIYCVNKPA